MQEITPISFYDFCENFSGRTILADVRAQYGEYSQLMADDSFCAFVKSGKFSTEVDFCFKTQKQFKTSVSVSKIIYKHHVKK